MYYVYSVRDSCIYEWRDEDALATELGHDYSKGNDWGPEDLVLDPQGRIGRIEFNGEFYEYRFTGERAAPEQLRSIATVCLRKNGWREDEVQARAKRVGNVAELHAAGSQLPPGGRVVALLVVIVAAACLLAFLVAFFAGAMWVGSKIGGFVLCALGCYVFVELLRHWLRLWKASRARRRKAANHRIRVLRERGVDVDPLPREVVPKDERE